MFIYSQLLSLAEMGVADDNDFKKSRELSDGEMFNAMKIKYHWSVETGECNSILICLHSLPCQGKVNQNLPFGLLCLFTITKDI